MLFRSAFAAVIARNSVSEDSRERVYTLVRQTLAAFATARRPDIIHLKALYCFARDEGYPVKQDWLRSLAAADRAAAAEILNQPLAAQTADAPVVARLSARLGDYLRGHTEILLE